MQLPSASTATRSASRIWFGVRTCNSARTESTDQPSALGLAYPPGMLTDQPLWVCTWCGGAAEDEQSLVDHQEWCLADAAANTQLMSDVARHDGELTQDALVAAARRRRAAGKPR